MKLIRRDHFIHELECHPTFQIQQLYLVLGWKGSGYTEIRTLEPPNTSPIANALPIDLPDH